MQKIQAQVNKKKKKPADKKPVEKKPVKQEQPKKK